MLQVIDDGIGVTPAHGERIGLSNTRARLDKLYGANHDLTLEPGPTGGTIATVSIPYRT